MYNKLYFSIYLIIISSLYPAYPNIAANLFTGRED
jgi:hypothetical protein